MKEYKEKQTDILNQMKDHSEGDHQFYLTANAVFNLATRATEIFNSSEVLEKRDLLNYLLQNCTLSASKLSFELKEPFDVIAETRHQPIGLPLQNRLGTLDWAKIQKHIRDLGLLNRLEIQS